jgi:hypothetical protein
VYHLRSAPGLADYEDGLIAFPNGRHDDQLGAAVYGADLGTPVAPVGIFPRVGLVSFTRGHGRTNRPYSMALGQPWDETSPTEVGWTPRRRIG